MPLNKSQQVAAEAYEGGEFAHVQSADEATTLGDGLFAFIMRELSDPEDCHGLGTATRRMDTAQIQINAVHTALHNAATG